MNALKIGQRVRATFVTLSSDPLADHKALHPERTGVIVYIHPKGRYVMVESAVRGGSVRECFQPGDVEVLGGGM